MINTMRPLSKKKSIATRCKLHRLLERKKENLGKNLQKFYEQTQPTLVRERADLASLDTLKSLRKDKKTTPDDDRIYRMSQIFQCENFFHSKTIFPNDQ